MKNKGFTPAPNILKPKADMIKDKRLIAKKNHCRLSLVRGFTLLEVVISIGILVIVSGIAVAASIGAVNLGTYSKNRTRAQEIARNQLERAWAMRDSDLRDDSQRFGWERGIDACLRVLYGRYPPVGSSASGFIGTEDATAGFEGRIDFDLSTCAAEGYGSRDYPDSPPYKIYVKVEKIYDDFNGGDNGDEGEAKTDYIDESRNMRRVTVTVTWEEPFLRGTQEVKAMTYLSNDKIGI